MGCGLGLGLDNSGLGLGLGLGLFSLDSDSDSDLLTSAGLGLGLGLESCGLGLGLGLGHCWTRYKSGNTSTPDECTIEELLAKYLRTEHGDSSDSDAFGFWMQRETESKYGKLLPAVLRAFAIPASSAPVERVFSHGGIMLRPNRARMSDKLLSELVFLKCNAL